MKDALNALYETLDFKSGSLLSATEKPNSSIKHNEWLEKGEWLAAAKRAGVDKIFFVDNNPVAVFAECKSDHIEKVKAFNRIWCLSRPRLLFLASPGELSVIDLAQKPLNVAQVERGGPGRREPLETLATLQSISKVTQELQQFHRDHIESGRVFKDKRFGDLKNRADQALIHDLKIVRRELIHAGLSGKKVKFAHALIGRSIFIRYLEDRRILTKDYYLKVARRTQGWTEILTNQSPRSGIDFSAHQSFYPRVLESKAFTYALFKMLAKDFNGDMFPNVVEEERVVTQSHLTRVQSLLYGDVGIQQRLFFYSYRFDIIPLDLISSIYEAFYHSSTDDDKKKRKARDDGAYYTPPVLAEFVLSRTLNAEILKKKPRVLDPACGSGIFLVEAFRRIVRYEWHKKKIRLDFDNLKQILRDQIAGIEVNEEAARITAFSLYLAMLHYLNPPAINEQIKQGNRLPNLLVSEKKSKNDFHCIWAGNAFDTEPIENKKNLSARFGQQCADVIVGNPPWGSLGKKATVITRARETVMLEWCHKNGKSIGDKESSQAFLWRSLDFLRDGGIAGMLVTAGVLFKHNTTSQAFRKKWMDSIKLDEIFNFTHVRNFFFKGAISPFLVICFARGKQNNCAVKYWSPKQVVALKETQAVLLSKYDVHILRKEDLTSSKLWKQYWFGRLADANFLKQLQYGKRLSDYVDKDKSKQGLAARSGKYSTKDFPIKRLLNIESFRRYDSSKALKFRKLPEMVYRLPKKEVFSGSRVLVKRGIEQKSEPKGQIIARYEKQSFCVTSDVNGIQLQRPEEWRYKTLLGIMWSSFSRYYFFLTASNWGLWHYEIYLKDELLQLPVIFNKTNPSTKKIIAIVDKLRNFSPHKRDVIHPSGVPEEKVEKQRRKWEKELDEAVFELYGMNEEQKDLIRDCCDIVLPFFYSPTNSHGVMPAIQGDDMSWIETYTRIFSRRWNAYLGHGAEMRAETHVGANGNLIAIEFFPANKGDAWNLKPKHDSWGDILEQIGKALPQPMGTSQIILDGVVHTVSDAGVIIIKRNEKRFWTRSLAREDADATLYKAMQKDRK